VDAADPAFFAKVGAERWWEYPQAGLGTRPLSEDGDLEWYVA